MGNLTIELKKIIEKETNGNLIKKLKNLGKLPSDFDESPLLSLIKHKNDDIRLYATKNLAKLHRLDLLETFIFLIEKDPSSKVRREAVSAIGRIRNKQTKPILFKCLSDPNPAIALQAIRGLLVFKTDIDVQEKLGKLINHPNEIISDIIKIEINKQPPSKNKTNHVASPNILKNIVIHGDAIDALKNTPEESVHLTFTSPPYYNARDYSIYQSYNEYLDFLEHTFKEVYRVTKEGRFFILNTSPIIIPRVGRKYSSRRYPIPYDIHPLLIKMGWIFIDDIVWVKPEASAKNRNAGFLQHRKPLAYKPNACSEMIMVYRKKTDKLIDWNIKQYDHNTVEESKINGDFESSNVWEIDPTFDKTHSAVFPLDLCNKIIKFYSYKGDLVLDPFAGSGTFGKAAIKNDRFFFLIEKDNTYIERIKENIGQGSIFTKNDYFPKVLTIEKYRGLIKNVNHSY